MPDPQLRPLRPDEWPIVAHLIHTSTNAWYRKNRGFDIFTAPPDACLLFPQTYEALDPNCCIVAQDPAAGHIIGSCFYHPRETHVSLGIMNVHPDFAGRGVASRLLRFITDLADRANLPTRLVSSAMNLDSFSLYSRAGFVPRAVYADMQIPAQHAAAIQPPKLDRHHLRPATENDVPAIANLEHQLTHIRRQQDHAFFIQNTQQIWRATVAENTDGQIDAFLTSVAHPASTMLGPGVMRNDTLAAALIADHLRHHAQESRAPVFLIPLDRPTLQQQMYTWGAKNLELHFAQTRGPHTPHTAVTMPTFMPETA
ncbi:MAG: Acetyltransferase [Phycisphaerales bacterium]|nr:Acetyltransferase [Phycisphaerales bacterium]